MDTIRCVGEIVAIFTSAAETLEFVKTRKEKKKKKKDREVEELVEIKILHKSLVEGATQCRRASEERYRRLGHAFGEGDAIASSALKDVMISLQTRIIQALQIARAVENAVLDLTSLHESSITCRQDAIRVLDSLCERISNRGSPPPTHQRTGSYDMRRQVSPATPPGHNAAHRVASSDSSGSYPNYYNGGSPPSQMNMPYPGSSPDMSYYHTAGMTPATPPMEMFQKSHASSYSWTGPMQYRQDEPSVWRSSNMSEEGEGEYRKMRELDRISQPSAQDFAIGSDVGIKHRHTSSLNSSAASEYRETSSMLTTGPIQRDRSPSNRSTSFTSHNAKRNIDDDLTSNSSETASLASRTAALTMDGPEDSIRDTNAPEVVIEGYESMLPHSPARRPGHVKRPSQLANMHPAMLGPGDYGDTALSPEADHVWSPLARPAKHNNYHGFCKGAWQMRKSSGQVQEGLSVKLIPNSGGVDVPHWTCKLCEFRSKATSSNPLPEQILFHTKCGVRYRWLFLAKSHIPATASLDKSDNYSYGCIFCAAEGRKSAVHEKLDNLMVHILSKHKTSMMTPETKEKTKCVVGGVADREDSIWDINLPESKVKSGFLR